MMVQQLMRCWVGGHMTNVLNGNINKSCTTVFKYTSSKRNLEKTDVERVKIAFSLWFSGYFWVDFQIWKCALDPEHSPSNSIATLSARNVIISSDYPSFWCRYWSEYMTIFKKCPIFSVFCVFLNKEWSLWHYLYIFVKLIKGATTVGNGPKHVAVFLGPWEIWPKKEISGSFIEHYVEFLNVVTKCDYLSLFMRYMQKHLFFVLFWVFLNEKYIWSHDFGIFGNV